ncbi:MAG: ammonium transporter, partial [Anaerolineae bacterium]
LIGLLTIPLAVVAYALVGFGLQFGGLGMVSDLPGAESLMREWSPLDVAWGPGWGIIGLGGFGVLGGRLGGDLVPLFLFQAALVATATAIPLLSLAKRLKFPLLLLISFFTGGILYPLFGNWVWGGGWLSQLGKNTGLGHGFIDFAGSGTVHLLGAGVALAGILVFGTRLKRRRRPVAPPPVHLPLLALLGTFLLLIGWLGVALGNPLLDETLPFAQVALNLMLSASGGLLAAAIYSWFTTGTPDALISLRGGVAGLVAASASFPFAPPWASLLIGAIAGLLLPLTVYLVEVKLRLDDPTAVVGIHAIPGVWGLLALGLFANGGSGVGWNGVGIGDYLGVSGQGVSGYLVVSGFQPDPTQLYAQLVGLGALVLLMGAVWLAFRGLDRLLMNWVQPRIELESLELKKASYSRRGQ